MTRKNTAYIDGKCSPYCMGGHPVLRPTAWRRFARLIVWARRGWISVKVEP